MSDELVRILRAEAHNLSADQLIELAVRHDKTMRQFDFIRIFKEAFPTVPLQIFKEASASRQVVGDEGVDENRINQLLDPYLKSRHNH